MEKHIKDICDGYLQNIKSTDEYVTYENERHMLEKFPDLYNRVNDYRDESFLLQNRYEGDELFDKVDELQERYDDILCDSRVSSFLHAESAFCRMMQEVNNYIVEGLDFK